MSIMSKEHANGEVCSDKSRLGLPGIKCRRKADYINLDKPESNRFLAGEFRSQNSE